MLLQELVGLAGIIGGMGVAWGISKAHTEKLWDEVREMKDWRNAHNVSTQGCQINVERTFGVIQARMDVNGERYDEILRRLEKIEKIVERRKDEV